ncbi:MAG: hypothetical protein JXA42_06885 [Anaerolineales bacterium]|nr:hypothetical protein [Anaerolineales bacterium]
MSDERQVRAKPAWGQLEEGKKSNREQCHRGDHTWVANFFESGHLAYWQCVDCGLKDREVGRLPERLETINGWIEYPPRLIARGHQPAVSTRRWVTPKGTILVEGDPSSIHFVGKVIPGLTKAHTYVEWDESDTIEAVYEPGRVMIGKSYDHFWLTRYQVIDEVLVQFSSYCYEESTYDVPSAGKPEQKIILSGLTMSGF